MKRFAKILLPAACMPMLIYLLRDGKYILGGIYLIFPLLYIAMGILCADLLKELLPCVLLTSVAFAIPFQLLFHMGSGIGEICIYFTLCCIAYFAKKLLLNSIAKKNIQQF